TRASASLLVRTLFEQTEQGPRRVFDDEDVDVVAAAYGLAHAKLVAKAIELGNLGEGAQQRAKKPSRKRQTSVS
ncbi:phage tail assembly chaperone, partial [Lactiplantibacillus plantarum]|uniref:phage tail assembly chaperone n=1 Tax=Lactiplantibacillus plantarum TaxID=1590 RepID=UPI001D0811A0